MTDLSNTRKHFDLMNAVQKPKKKYSPDYELFLKIFEEQYEQLPPEIKKFYDYRFCSPRGILSYVNRTNDFRKFNCNGKMKRELSCFITHIRNRLEKHGFRFPYDKISIYPKKINQKTETQSSKPEPTPPGNEKKKKITPAPQAKNLPIGLKGKRVERVKILPLEKEFNPEAYCWSYKDDEYLRTQYHDLICAFPYNTRKIIIEHLPTVYDFYLKAKGTSFSSRLEEKTELDLFLNIFRKVYLTFPYQKFSAVRLFKQRTGKCPINDLTLEESIQLNILENIPACQRKNQNDNNSLPLQTNDDENTNSHWEPRFLEHYETMLCEQKDIPTLQLEELFSPDNAYADFTILAVTLQQAAKEVVKKLSALKRKYGNYDRFQIYFYTKSEIRMFAHDRFFLHTDYLFLSKENDKIYLFNITEMKNKQALNLNPVFFELIYEKELEFQTWLERMNAILVRLSNGRLNVVNDYYKIKIQDKTNKKSCSLFTFIKWMENNDIGKVKSHFLTYDTEKFTEHSHKNST